MTNTISRTSNNTIVVERALAKSIAAQMANKLETISTNYTISIEPFPADNNLLRLTIAKAE